MTTLTISISMKKNENVQKNQFISVLQNELPALSHSLENDQYLFTGHKNDVFKIAIIANSANAHTYVIFFHGVIIERKEGDSYSAKSYQDIIKQIPHFAEEAKTLFAF